MAVSDSQVPWHFFTARKWEVDEMEIEQECSPTPAPQCGVCFPSSVVCKQRQRRGGRRDLHIGAVVKSE